MEKAMELIDKTVWELYTIANTTEDDTERTRIYKSIDTLNAEKNTMYDEYMAMTEAKAKELFGEF